MIVITNTINETTKNPYNTYNIILYKIIIIFIF